MTDYIDMIDMIIMHNITHRNNNMVRMPQVNQTKFSNLLKKHMSKTETKTGPLGPLKKISMQNRLNPLMDIAVNQKERGDFETALEVVLRHEGKRPVGSDGSSSEASRYGILQSTARAMGFNGNIKDITIEQARAIYERLWDQSGAANLPAPLSIVYFDTYVNSPAMAKKLLAKSKNDINTFLDMREQRYIKLAEKRPDIFGRYLKGWKNRVNNLRIMVAGLQGKGIAKGA